MWLYIAPMLSTYRLHLRPCSETLCLVNRSILRNKHAVVKTWMFLNGPAVAWTWINLHISQHCQWLIDTERSICLIASLVVWLRCFLYPISSSKLFWLILFVRSSCVLVTLTKAWAVLGDKETSSPHGGAEAMDGARVFPPACFQSIYNMLQIWEQTQRFIDETGGRWRPCAPRGLSS